MKIWLGGEIDSTVIDFFRPIRNSLESRINNYIDSIEFSSTLKKFAVVFTISEHLNEEYSEYRKRDKQINVNININASEFLRASETEREKIIFEKIIYACQIAIKNNKFDSLTDLDNIKAMLISFKQEEIIQLEGLERIELLFKKMKDNGFDVDRELEWSFSFFSEHKEKLLEITEELKELSYEMEFQHKNDYWFLIFKKIELLAADKLSRRNDYFIQLAAYCDVNYDGWEAGIPVVGSSSSDDLL